MQHSIHDSIHHWNYDRSSIFLEALSDLRTICFISGDQVDAILRAPTTGHGASFPPVLRAPIIALSVFCRGVMYSEEVLYLQIDTVNASTGTIVSKSRMVREVQDKLEQNLTRSLYATSWGSYLNCTASAWPVAPWHT